jgi:amino acid transporter
MQVREILGKPTLKYRSTLIYYHEHEKTIPGRRSACTYVGRGIHPYLGFLTGWAMLLDYVVIPLFCVIYGSLSIQRLFSEVPLVFWSAFIAGAITYLNLRGFVPRQAPTRSWSVSCSSSR